MVQEVFTGRMGFCYTKQSKPDFVTLTKFLLQCQNNLESRKIRNVAEFSCGFGQAGNTHELNICYFVRQCNTFIYCILASCYIRLTLNICYFVRQCNTLIILYFSILLHSFNTEYLLFCPSMQQIH
jgi:hypothetical protein